VPRKFTCRGAHDLITSPAFVVLTAADARALVVKEAWLLPPGSKLLARNFLPG
jgi:hypothetical protein